MRNLKKLLAVIVSVCVLATFALPAFAAELTAAEIVEDLGVLKGDSSEGVTATYLAKGTSRMQAAVLTLRLIGKEDEAYAFEGEDNFADADQTWDNAKVALAYLKANPELGWQGVSESANTFDPKAEISAQQMYKVCLEALGYKQDTDFTWAEVFTFAADKGLTLIADVTDMTNNDVATALVEALKATMKDGKTTLIADLVAKGVVTEAAAIAAGLIAAEPEDLEVEDVEADNLVRVVVTFNKAIDKDSIDDGDFVVDDYDVKSDDVTLSDDKMVATLKLDDEDPMSNGDEIEIAISGIKAVDGTELADYEGEFTPQDKEAPKVESIEFTGPETIKVTFTEPMNQPEVGDPENGEVIIDGGVYNGSPIGNYDNGTGVTIDLGTELDEGEHTFKVKGFKDFAGYSNIVNTLTVEYVSIDEAPSVEVKKATQSYVILKFERPVKGVEIDDFYQTYSNWKPLEVQNEDGDEVLNEDDYYDVVRLAFTNAEKVTPGTGSGADDNDKPVPVGKAKIVVKDESVEDRWGNEIDGDITLTAEITADTEKPEVTKVTVESEKEIRVYFNESVDKKDATDDDSYTIKDTKNKVISTSRYGITYNDSDKYAAIKFTKALDKGDYEITIEAIADASISRNLLDTVKFDFKVTDKSASLSGVVATWIPEDSVIFIKYGDEMDAKSVLDEDNYRIGPNSKKFDDLFTDPADGDVRLSMYTSKIVKVQFRGLTPTQKATIVAGNKSLQIGRVKDAAGNVVPEFAKVIDIIPEVAPVITGVKVIAKNKFELTVNQELKSIPSGAIMVAKDGTNTSSASYKITDLNGDKTKVVVTVPKSQESNTTEAIISAYAITVIPEKIKSMTGKYMDGITITAAAADATNADGQLIATTFGDGVAPEFVKDGEGDKIIYAYDKDNNNLVDHFIVKYSEDISLGSISSYTFKVDGYKVKGVTVSNLTSMSAVKAAITAGPLATVAGGKYLVITVDELGDDATDDTDQTPEVEQVLSIKDIAGNEFEAQKGEESVSVIGQLTGTRD